MTRAADIERGIEIPAAPLVYAGHDEAEQTVERIRKTPCMGDAWMLYSGYEEGWIIEWYPRGKRGGNAYVMPDGTAYDHQLRRTVKTGLPV